MDVLKGNGSHMASRQLIRLGKAENPALMHFTERNSTAETEAKRGLESTLSVIKDCTVKMHQCLLPLNHFTAATAAIAYLKCCVSSQDLLLTAEVDPKVAFRYLQSFCVGDKNVLGLAKDSLPMLMQEAEHWIRDGTTVLHEWLQGKMPPPRCEKECIVANQLVRCEQSTRGSRYCLQHGCKYAGCQHMCIDVYQYCQEHKCSAEGCAVECLQPSRFCAGHTCSYCLDHPAIIEIGACMEHICTVYGCKRMRLFPLLMCVQHKCQLCNKFVDVLFQDYSDAEGYCIDHKCKVDDCMTVLAYSVQRREIARYCQDHLCFKCVEYGMGVQSETHYPRYTCSLHNLCQFITCDGDYCNELASDGAIYCTEHLQSYAIVVTCSGTKTKNKRCKASKPLNEPYQNPWYCQAHLKQRSQQLMEKKAQAPISMQANTVLQIVDLPDGFRATNQLPSRASLCAYHGCKVLTANHNLEWMCPFHYSTCHQSMRIAPILEDSMDVQDVCLKEEAIAYSQLEEQTEIVTTVLAEETQQSSKRSASEGWC